VSRVHTLLKGLKLTNDTDFLKVKSIATAADLALDKKEMKVSTKARFEPLMRTLSRLNSSIKEAAGSDPRRTLAKDEIIGIIGRVGMLLENHATIQSSRVHLVREQQQQSQ
jgi:hypothetical protein